MRIHIQARNLRLQGAADGSTRLLFGLGGGLRLHECINTTLSRITIDYAPFVPFVQAQIIAAMPIIGPTILPTPPHPTTATQALGYPPAVLAPCSKDPSGFHRPLPPCPAGWWQDGSICMQACLLNNQGRSPSGRCLCGGPSPDNGCEPGLQCEAGQCIAAGNNNGWQRWQLNVPWTGYISSTSPPANGGNPLCLNVGYCNGKDLIGNGCYHSGSTCAGGANFSIFEFFLEPATVGGGSSNASHRQHLRSGFGGCVRATGGSTLALAPCDAHDDAQLWTYLPSLQLQNGVGGDGGGCLSLKSEIPPPPPNPPPPAPPAPPMVQYTLELSPRSLPLAWPDVAHGVLWDGKTNWSLHEGIPTPGSARHLQGRQWSWSTSIAGATVGDWVTFAGRDNFTIVVANSSGCTVKDVTILTSPGFAITEIDGGGGHVYRRVRVGSHGQPSGDRYLVGANADAFHSVDVEHGPLLEGCDFSGNCDDFANVHSTIHVLYSRNSSSSNGSANMGSTAEWLMIDPRLVALGATPIANLTDMWYGTSSPMANMRVGDTFSCYYPNTKPRGARGKDGWRRWGTAALRLRELPEEVRDTADLAAAAAVHDSVNRAGGANQQLMGWTSLKLWRVALDSAGGPPLPPLPAGNAVLCGVDRFGGRGAVLRGNYFHDLGTNGGLRWKSSDSTIENNTIRRAGNASSTWVGRATTGVEVSALQDWMEGAMSIDSVRVVGNRWEDCGIRTNPVTVMPEASNITETNNSWN